MVRKQSRAPATSTNTALHQSFGPWQPLTFHLHTRTHSTESQEVAIDRKITATTAMSSRYDTDSIVNDEYNDSIRSQSGRTTTIRPSLDGSLFECHTPTTSDRYHRRASVESIDSQIMLIDAIVQENDSDDDDDSILSQIKDMAAVEISRNYQQQDQDDTNTIGDMDDDDDDDDSLTSIVSKAYSMASSTSSTSWTECTTTNGRRRVVFGSVEVYYIPNRNDYTPEEVSNVWYRHQDMADMRMERFEEEVRARQEPEQLIKVPELESLEELGSVSRHLESPLHAQHLAGAFHRGSCNPTDNESEARIHALVDAVMDEQETQWLDDYGEDDPQKIAEASMACSSACKKDALMRAHLDALEAIPFYLEIDSDDTLCNSVRSSRSQRRRKDEEIYPLSPMSVSPRVRLTKIRTKNGGTKKSKTVSESRWTPMANHKSRAYLTTRKMITKIEHVASSEEEKKNKDAVLPMPKRMASNHGNEGAAEAKLGLTMPRRMASDHGTEPSNQDKNTIQKLGLTMPRRLASDHANEGTRKLQRQISSSELSLDSELEFGGDDGCFSQEMAPPTTIPEAVPVPSTTNTDGTATETKVAAKKSSRTCKFSSKDKKDDDHKEGGIYQKVKRKLKGSKKKTKSKGGEKKTKGEKSKGDKKDKQDTKRKKKSKSGKTKKKKVKSQRKSKASTTSDDHGVVVDEQLETSASC